MELYNSHCYKVNKSLKMRIDMEFSHCLDILKCFLMP